MSNDVDTKTVVQDTSTNTKTTKRKRHALVKRLHNFIPPFPAWKKPVKQAIALLIGVIMTLSDRCREAIGPGSLLCAIVVIFYFPARTFGVVLEVSAI